MQGFKGRDGITHDPETLRCGNRILNAYGISALPIAFSFEFDSAFGLAATAGRLNEV